MDFRASFSRTALSVFPVAVALVLCGCSTIDYRTAEAPIEVIESNYIESTNDAEIVRAETPSQTVAALAPREAS